MERNSFLVIHAFRNYLKASLISSACMQLTVMIDAMVAGNFIGPDALTAINLAIPLTSLVTALSTLIGLGPAMMAAKAIGSRQTDKVNSIFSAAMYQAIFIGLLQGVIIYALLPQVGGWLCSNERLLPYLMEYIQVLPLTFFLLMIVFTMVGLIESDGHPNFATKAMVLGSLFNIVFDVVLVKCFDLGVQGIAFGMFANYLSVFLYFIFRMKREGVSYRWTRPRRDIVQITISGLKEGMPMMINDSIYSLTIFGVNYLLMTYYGETELYFWAVFLQILLIVMVIVDCSEGAVLSIGSVLDGEDDKYGLSTLVRRSWLLVGGIVLGLVILVCAFPVQIALLFGDSVDVPENWPQTVRILSLMLVPYALTTYMRSVFQVLGSRFAGVFFALGQFVLILAGLYVSVRFNAKFLWWTFPVSSWILFAFMFLYMAIVRKRKHIPEFSIIPMSPEKTYLDLSVDYDNKSVSEAIQLICSFMQEHKVDKAVEMKVNICCEELMTNIVLYQTHKTRSYMDLSLILEEHRIFFVLKDSGRPFNPVLVSATPEMLEEDVQLGLFLVNRVSTILAHKYMYGLNVVFAQFDMNND